MRLAAAEWSSANTYAGSLFRSTNPKTALPPPFCAQSVDWDNFCTLDGRHFRQSHNCIDLKAPAAYRQEHLCRRLH